MKLKILSLIAALCLTSVAEAQVTTACVSNLAQYKADSTRFAGYAAGVRKDAELRMVANTINACGSAGVQRSLVDVLAELQRIAKPRTDTVIRTVTITQLDTIWCITGTTNCSTSGPPPVTPPVTPPCTNCAGMPNLPAGLTTIGDWDGGAATTHVTWIAPETQVLTDAAAPKSPPTIRRFTNPADPARGQVGGGNISIDDTKSYQEMYVARWLKASANYDGANAGSKSMFIGIGNASGSDFGGNIYVNYERIGNNHYMLPIIEVSASPDPLRGNWLVKDRAGTIANHAGQSVPRSGPLPRDQWGLWEVYVKMNTPGQKNGVIRTWCNGVLQLEIVDFEFQPTGRAWGFKYAQTNFYQNVAQTYPMWWDMDHMFVAAR